MGTIPRMTILLRGTQRGWFSWGQFTEDQFFRGSCPWYQVIFRGQLTGELFSRGLFFWYCSTEPFLTKYNLTIDKSFFSLRPRTFSIYVMVLLTLWCHRSVFRVTLKLNYSVSQRTRNNVKHYSDFLYCW